MQPVTFGTVRLCQCLIVYEDLARSHKIYCFSETYPMVWANCRQSLACSKPLIESPTFADEANQGSPMKQLGSNSHASTRPNCFLPLVSSAQNDLRLSQTEAAVAKRSVKSLIADI